MVRFPHQLFLVRKAETNPDVNGDFARGVESEKFITECRTEPNGSGRLISLTDGKTYQYSSLIYSPTNCGEMKAGDTIIVKNNGVTMYRSQIAGISYDQKHTRIWV